MSTSIRIPFYKRTHTESEIEAVAECIRSGQLSQGLVVAEFEEAFRQYVGSKYAVAVNSCTSGAFPRACAYKTEKSFDTLHDFRVSRKQHHPCGGKASLAR